ncbi:hypothetical protein BDV19DRAFT_257785 [Aspergillus venezuelensis]
MERDGLLQLLQVDLPELSLRRPGYLIKPIAPWNGLVAATVPWVGAVLAALIGRCPRDPYQRAKMTSPPSSSVARSRERIPPQFQKSHRSNFGAHLNQLQ